MPMQTFYYQLDGRDINCEVEYEEGERETFSEPGFPPSADLFSATENGIDITEELFASEILEIEVAFLNQEYEY